MRKSRRGYLPHRTENSNTVSEGNISGAIISAVRESKIKLIRCTDYNENELIDNVYSNIDCFIILDG